MDLQLGIIPEAQVTPWEPKKKKQKGIGSFFTQKSQDVVRKEREAADAVGEQVRLDAAQRKVTIDHKFDAIVLKWKLPAQPDLTRRPGETGRTLVADVRIHLPVNC